MNLVSPGQRSRTKRERERERERGKERDGLTFSPERAAREGDRPRQRGHKRALPRVRVFEWPVVDFQFDFFPVFARGHGPCKRHPKTYWKGQIASLPVCLVWALWSAHRGVCTGCQKLSPSHASLAPQFPISLIWILLSQSCCLHQAEVERVLAQRWRPVIVVGSCLWRRCFWSLEQSWNKLRNQHTLSLCVFYWLSDTIHKLTPSVFESCGIQPIWCITGKSMNVDAIGLGQAVDVDVLGCFFLLKITAWISQRIHESQHLPPR